MNTYITFAIGADHILEADRLKASVPELLVITTDHPFYQEEVPGDTFANALLAKTRFADFLPVDAQGPVFLCDADLYSVVEGNPFEFFPDMGDADIAAVAYPGNFYFPPSAEYQAASYSVLGKKLNAGLVWFKDLATAQAVATAWAVEFRDYMSTIGMLSTGDELALMAVLVAHPEWKIAWLDQKWNNLWRPQEGDIIRHAHITGSGYRPGEIEPPAPPVPPAPRIQTKLTIMRRLDAMGKWPTFKAVLAQLPEIVQDSWALALDINESDPLFAANREALIAALGLTGAEIDSLFDPA